jgi:hypothetical protein
MGNLLAVITALIAIESGGNPLAVGDHGEARGVLQIHQCVIADVNRFAHTRYTWDDAWDEGKSVAICVLYVRHYATPQRLGHAPTAEDVARVWNGGPDGWKKPSTRRYWQGVSARLSRQ